ncbi:MAG TPA: hypothetical protein VI933_05065 [archaeon]|nr:hypothetical protein [archaeon]
MPEFVPVLLLALATITAMYLGFVLQQQQIIAPSGFVSINSQPQQGKNIQQTTTTQIISDSAKKMSGVIYLGDSAHLSADEPELLADFSEEVSAKDADSQKAAGFFVDKDYDQLFLKFDISETNSYGEFKVFINNEEVYRGAPKAGMHEIQIFRKILQDENTLRIEASGGFLFTPAKYSFQVKLFGLTGEHMEYHFSTSDSSARLMEASVKGSGSFKILLNREEIFSGSASDYIATEVPKGFVTGENILEIFPSPNSDLNVEFLEFFKK